MWHIPVRHGNVTSPTIITEGNKTRHMYDPIYMRFINSLELSMVKEFEKWFTLIKVYIDIYL